MLSDFHKISVADLEKMTQFTKGEIALKGVTDGTRNLTSANLDLLREEGHISVESYNAAKAFIKSGEAAEQSAKKISISKGILSSVSTWITIATIAISAGIAMWNSYQEAQRQAYEDTIEQADKSAEAINKTMQAWDLYASLGTEATEQEKETAIKNVNEQLKDKIQLLGDATNAEKKYADSVLASAKADLQTAYDRSNAARAETEDKIKIEEGHLFKRKR